MTSPGTARPARRQWRWASLVERPSPIVKQGPTILLLVIAVIIVVAAPGIEFTSLPDAIIGIAGIAAASVLATVMTLRGAAWDGWIVMLVPIIDIVALGLFRSGTGGAASMFGGFVLLPVIWLATAPLRRYIVIAVALTVVVQIFPYLREPPEVPEQWLRGLITPLVFGMVAVVVSELSRALRQRADLAERLADFRSAALQENSEVLVQLREGEQRYRRLLAEFQSVWDATTAQAVISTDLDGVVLRWNPGAEKLFGRTEKAVQGVLRIDELFPPEALKLLADGAAAAEPGETMPVGVLATLATAAGGDSVDRDLELYGPHGDIVPMRVTVTARRDDAGEHLGYLLVVTDETRAAEVSRMKDEFVGMISHELRTPLTSILGYLDLLRHDESSPLAEDQQQFLGVIERNANRLLKLVTDLLFTAQVESGRFSLDLRELDIVPVIAAAIESAAPAAERAGLQVVADLPESAPTFRFDPERIGQAVDNLVSNAIKFTPRGGRIVVGLTVGAATMCVAVRDTGLGIPDDEVGRLAVRFFRASTATRNAIPGVGLGLTITKAIIIAHGGWMDFSSRIGEGTEVQFYLPRQAGSVAATQTAALEDTNSA
jgi:PAS domain S-box-containing protein